MYTTSNTLRRAVLNILAHRGSASCQMRRHRLNISLRSHLRDGEAPNFDSVQYTLQVLSSAAVTRRAQPSAASGGRKRVLEYSGLRRADGRGYSSTRDCAGGRKRVLEYSRLRRADGKRRCPTDECFGNIQVPPAGSIEIERRVERLEQRRVGSQANIAKLCDLYKQLATDVRATLPVALPVAFVRSAAAWNGVQCNYGASVPRYSMPCRLSHVSAVGGYRQWLHAWHRPSRLSNDRHGTAACDLAWMTSLRGSAHL